MFQLITLQSFIKLLYLYNPVKINFQTFAIMPKRLTDHYVILHNVC